MTSQLRVDKIVPVDGAPTSGGGGIVQVKQTLKQILLQQTLSLCRCNWEWTMQHQNLVQVKYLNDYELCVGVHALLDGYGRLMRDSNVWI